ncbi:uncharacterized protein LOC123317261 [Coccinella septempunctata]|uniref:uncharacterized protein LOC123317261 n=1 Tax=Coccinella septempunctata TaxID=41139 RepID=UPI001D070CEC|nr:uncharacterized protein LOC123317261 [Coccinella septempunctata]
MVQTKLWIQCGFWSCECKFTIIIYTDHILQIILYDLIIIWNASYIKIFQGVIIGSETKKPLFLGVRNKACSACSFYRNRNIPPKSHICAMNFSGPSTGMEQDIIVEGFSKSIEHHGVMYKYLIGDGDSSVYARVVEKVSYGRDVVKIQCANHMTRCVSDKLHRLSKNTSFNISNRKILTKKDGPISNIERLVKSVRTIVKNNAQDTVMLRNDLRNALYHVFGNHSNCRDSYCKRKNSGEEDYTKNMTPDFFMEILTNIEPMVHKADRLIYNETTNQAERYMALVAKCTGGKRVNFSGSVSYTVRAYGAALSHAAGPAWHLHTWRGPLGVNTEKTFLRRRKIHERRREKLLSTSRKRKTLSNGPDSNYGPDAAQPDITEEEMSSKKSEFLNILRNRISDSSKLKDLEEKTRGQHDNALWRQYRQDYLTSSNFGSVVKRKSTTPCHNFVKVLLYKKQLNTAGVLYGRMNESKAVSLYEHSKNIKVTRCSRHSATVMSWTCHLPHHLLS